MKIRTRLFTLIFSMLLAMIISLSVYLVFEKIIKITENEKSELLLLKDIMQQEHIILSGFLYDKTILIEQIDILRETIETKNKTLIN
nr:hypothetical protein [Spirochaetaceae bacterium]